MEYESNCLTLAFSYHSSSDGRFFFMIVLLDDIVYIASMFNKLNGDLAKTSLRRDASTTCDGTLLTCREMFICFQASICFLFTC